MHIANENTASSAEFIFIEGLLKSFGENVKIIGRTTQGISGQAAVLKVNEDVVLNMTVKRYYHKKGSELNLGYRPDYDVEMISDGKLEDKFIKKFKEIKNV